MTMISQWLRCEEKDRSEPPGFYIPGAVEWYAKIPAGLTYGEWEIQVLIDLWSKDEQ